MKAKGLKNDTERFSISSEFIDSVINDPEGIDEIDGYHGQPITGVGDVYTPPSLVEFVLDMVDYKESEPIENLRIIDLSCGTGSFVVEIVRRLRSRLNSLGYDSDNPDGARHIISTIRNNIAAADLNSMAVWGTAQLVVKELEEEISTIPVDNPVENLPVYHTNSLHPNSGLINQRFSRVVGNPPYIKNREIDEEMDEIYRKEFKTANGKYDIYPLFFERGLQILSPGGYMGLVTPQRFHITDYGEPLRNLLTTKSRINAIVNLTDDPFPVVNAYPSITIAEKIDGSFPKYQYENYLRFCEVPSNHLSQLADEIAEGSSQESMDGCATISQDDLKGSTWQFSPPKYTSLKERMESQFVPISQLPIEIRAGVATGADDVFIVGEKDAKRMDNELIYPIIRGKNIRKGKIRSSNQFIINPYTMAGNPVQIEEYPAAFEYLSHFRKQLEERYVVREGGKRWFETHDTINTRKEVAEKIATPDITSETRFVTTSGVISHNSAYSLYYPRDIELLSAILNSSPIEFLLKMEMPKMDDGYWRQMKRDLKNIRILDPEQLPNSLQEDLKNGHSQSDWERIDELLFDYIGLSNNEQRLVKEYLSN